MTQKVWFGKKKYRCSLVHAMRCCLKHACVGKSLWSNVADGKICHRWVTLFAHFPYPVKVCVISMHHLIMCRNYLGLWLLSYYATLQALPDNKVVLWNRFMKVITSDVYHINSETVCSSLIYTTDWLCRYWISSIIKARKCLFEIISDLASHASSKSWIVKVISCCI